MTSDSKYFDMIRIKPASKGKAAAQKSLPNCQWKGCDKPGHHKAPKGHGHDGEFFVFCATHVKHYNASYNYFEGMSDKDISDFSGARRMVTGPPGNSARTRQVPRRAKSLQTKRGQGRQKTSTLGVRGRQQLRNVSHSGA